MQELALSFGFGVITASVLSLAAVAITLQFGITNYINFAFGSYATLAAYLAWELNVQLHLSFWLAVLGSASGMGIFSVVVGRFLLQPYARRNLPYVYLLIVTLALWLIISNGIVALWGPNSKQFDVPTETPLVIGPFLFTRSQLLIILVAIVTLSLVHVLLTRTKLGKALRAMSDDVPLAQVTGINTELMTMVTWFLTGLLVGLAGCVLALNLVSFQPSSGDDLLFVMFAAVILGGVGQVYGTMLGAVIVGLATEMSTIVVPSAYKIDVAFGLLILMLLVRPQGLVPARKV